MLHYGSHFIDLHGFRASGLSLWLLACRRAQYLQTPMMLRSLLRAGADVTEVDDQDGRNCLFHCVIGQQVPGVENGFVALRFLLTVFDDIFAKDFHDTSIFDYLENLREWLMEENRWDGTGSYKEDLWYCALYRSGLEDRHQILPPTHGPCFTSEYRPHHYRALMCLDSWELSSHDCRSSKEEYPWCPEGKEQMPGFAEWEPAHLAAMEERMIHACYAMAEEERDQGPTDASSDEWSEADD